MKKYCVKCQKDTERHKSGKCSACNKARCLSYRSLNIEKINVKAAKWRAENVEKKSIADAKYRSENKEKIAARKSAYYVKNKESESARSARWYVENAEKVAAKNAAKPKGPSLCRRIWEAKNKDKLRVNVSNRRARMISGGGKLSKDIVARLVKLQRGKCACCGLPLGDDYNLDHIMPLSRGGTNTDYNIQLLRATCNRQKKAKHPVEFMQSRGFLL